MQCASSRFQSNAAICLVTDIRLKAEIRYKTKLYLWIQVGAHCNSWRTLQFLANAATVANVSILGEGARPDAK